MSSLSPSDNATFPVASLSLRALDNSPSRQMSNQARRKRLRWTPQLHAIFVNSVLALGGGNKATPKEILRHMQSEGTGDGLTVDHIKSHLQKYRMCIKLGDIDGCSSGDESGEGAGTAEPMHAAGHDRLYILHDELLRHEQEQQQKKKKQQQEQEEQEQQQQEADAAPPLSVGGSDGANANGNESAVSTDAEPSLFRRSSNNRETWSAGKLQRAWSGDKDDELPPRHSLPPEPPPREPAMHDETMHEGPHSMSSHDEAAAAAAPAPRPSALHFAPRGPSRYSLPSSRSHSPAPADQLHAEVLRQAFATQSQLESALRDQLQMQLELHNKLQLHGRYIERLMSKNPASSAPASPSQQQQQQAAAARKLEERLQLLPPRLLLEQQQQQLEEQLLKRRLQQQQQLQFHAQQQQLLQQQMQLQQLQDKAALLMQGGRARAEGRAAAFPPAAASSPQRRPLHVPLTAAAKPGPPALDLSLRDSGATAPPTSKKRISDASDAPPPGLNLSPAPRAASTRPALTASHTSPTNLDQHQQHHELLSLHDPKRSRRSSDPAPPPNTLDLTTPSAHRALHMAKQQQQQQQQQAFGSFLPAPMYYAKVGEGGGGGGGGGGLACFNPSDMQHMRYITLPAAAGAASAGRAMLAVVAAPVLMQRGQGVQAQGAAAQVHARPLHLRIGAA